MSDIKFRIGGNGTSFCGLLTAIFITLKLCKIISWPWIWVLSPLLIGIVLGIVTIVLIIGTLVFIDRRF